MKSYFSTLLTLACAALVIILVMIKGGDNTQHEKDVGAIADYSNRLDSAQTQLAICNGTILTLSNNLDQSRSASLTSSNRFAEAQSTMALNTKQIASLSRQVAEVESANQVLSGRVTDLTNQMAGLTTQLISTGTNLAQANKDYALLENRLRRDVAERVVVERKFNNLLELQAQLQHLKKHPVELISADSIYAGLDVEVKSNAFHVISPN